jgi:hypothetical protein
MTLYNNNVGQVHGGFLILYGNRLLHVAEFFKGIIGV